MNSKLLQKMIAKVNEIYEEGHIQGETQEFLIFGMQKLSEQVYKLEKQVEESQSKHSMNETLYS